MAFLSILIQDIKTWLFFAFLNLCILNITEQQLAMANGNKIKEVRQELSHEKSRYSTLERQYQEKIAAQTQEIQALHSRMQSTHDNHLIESSRMQAHINKLEQSQNKGQLQQLMEVSRTAQFDKSYLN